MARVLVVTSSPLFVEGGHLVIARALVRALRERGHEAGLRTTPQNRFGRQSAAYLATWLTDLTCAEVVYCDDKQNIALDLGKQMLNKYPDLKLIMAICSPAVPRSSPETSR